ncbi:MAG: bifunctional YncE family protein/alkaline phosphatase family protein [Terracidiphilus sp.]
MSRNNLRINFLFVGLLTAGLSLPAFAQSVPFPTYTVGENTSASTGPTYSSPLPDPWVVSNGTIITPAGTQVYLGITTRTKAVAVNPTGNGTAAAMQLSAPQAVSIFCTASAGCNVNSTNYATGQVIQKFTTSGYTTGAGLGLAYTSDGKYLLFSQYSSYVAIANVAANGTLTSYARISVPASTEKESITISNGTTSTYTVLTNAYDQCNPNSPPGTSGGSGNSAVYPCGDAYSGTISYPLGIAVAPVVAGQDTIAYVVLDTDNSLEKIDLTSKTAVGNVVVGNVPNSVVISPDGTAAYVSNEAGRRVTPSDSFTEYSDGTPVVANNPAGSTATGTVSVVNLSNFTVTGSISTGLHPTGMAFWTYGGVTYLLVANAYSDSISVVNTETNTVAYTISLGLPIAIPGTSTAAYGAGPNSIAVDQVNNIAYVALYNANAVAVVNLPQNSPGTPVRGLIPVGYAPSSVALDTADDALIVANDKGLGTTGYGVAAPPTSTAENSYGTSTPNVGGVLSFNTHQDLGTASIVSLPITPAELSAYTKQVHLNNHWDLAVNIQSASGGLAWTAPVAIPAKIGAPSLIKHVFMIIRENRTFDQIMGDVPDPNGPNGTPWTDPALAALGGPYSQYLSSAGNVTPNVHALVQRFPLFDNYYNPSRQSADGHNWIVQAMAPYSDDIQSPGWERDYPSNGGDSLAYQTKGHIWDTAAAAGVSVKNFGEYVEYDLFNTPTGSTTEPTWQKWYQDTQCYEAANVGQPGLSAPIADGGVNCETPGTAGESQLYYYNTVSSFTPLPILYNDTVQQYPQFDLTIVDQYRFDIWNQVFQSDIANNSVPQLEFMWISSDHTGSEGALNAEAQVADNDLAVGRFVDAISHSPIWSSSAIFVTEDDAQYGIDHIDGHRSPGYLISPYVNQNVIASGPTAGNGGGSLQTGAGLVYDHTFYTQVNMTRTIEQILGIQPMNQYDLVASPMSEIFINNPPAANFLPWSHVANAVPLYTGLGAQLQLKGKARDLQVAWLKEKAEIFKGKLQIPDSEDPFMVSHIDWYEATKFSIPFPGEKKVFSPSELKRIHKPVKAHDDDGL